MYTRNVSLPSDSENDKGIPENYSGYTMSMKNQPSENSEEAQKTEENPSGVYGEKVTANESSQPVFNYADTSDRSAHKESGLFSALLEKIGIKGAESSDITLLIIALLLLSGETDDYIWILLLLLLLVK